MYFGEHFIPDGGTEAQLCHHVPRSITLISTTGLLHMDLMVEMNHEFW